MHFPRVFLTSQRANRNLHTTRRKINTMTLTMKENKVNDFESFVFYIFIYYNNIIISRGYHGKY